MVIVSIPGDATGSDPRTQIADEHRDSGDHHYDADVHRHQPVTASPRSMAFASQMVTIERVAQHEYLAIVPRQPPRVNGSLNAESSRQDSCR
ncbi:hypothetical protein [Conexibacter sp. DBS9H8]|uniref:hypothetical protein n=1 Tax=Conexibacter sp. DBS9H8 TaxID=2937801 RepID=UPI00200BA67C|nr:hypothetical protein [Conexibacter sp. DBS9H8]